MVKNNIKNAYEYIKAIDELHSLIDESGIEKDVLFQLLHLIKRIEEYEITKNIESEKRIYTILQNGDVKHTEPARTAIISDIHGNYNGFVTVLEDIKINTCDRIVCLGDLVDGGEGDVEVVRFVRDQNILCVLGNHDQYNDLSLPKDVADFLSNLSVEIIESDIIYTHISPKPKRVTVKDEIEAWNVFDETDYRLSFVGHSHVANIFGDRSEFPCTATRHSFEYNQPFKFDRSDRYIISVGPIGYNRDGFKKLRYGIYDHLNDSVEIRAVGGELLPYG
jgi:predicted phosphodiesterase